MNRRYQKQFYKQRINAIKRGIEWQLTYEEWINWWGDDIERRGSGQCDLQMQRIADSGPYALWNIKKGHPRDNSKTRSIVVQNAKAKKAHEEHQRYLDALMFARSEEPPDEDKEEKEIIFYDGAHFAIDR